MRNKKDRDNFEEKVILNSLGLLKKEESDSYKLMMDGSSGKERMMVSEYNNLASLFPKILSTEDKKKVPSPKTKEKLFEKLNTRISGQSKKNKTGFGFIFADSLEWMPHPELKGIEVKQLAVNEEKGYLMLLIKAAAGAEYPSHKHSGAEECYVIEGDLIVEGKVLGPGDFHHADGGSDHDPLRTKNGCTLLLVADPRDY